MSHTRFVTALSLFACMATLAHCGSDDSKSGGLPASPDSGAAGDGGANDGSLAPTDGGDAGADASASDADAGAAVDANDGALDATHSIDADAEHEASAPSMDATTSAPVDAGVHDASVDAGVHDASVGVDASDGGTDVSAPPPALTPFVCGGVTCKADEFCATTGGDAGVDGGSDGSTPGPVCKTVAFANLCDNPAGTLYFDPNPSDNAATTTLGSAFASACGTTIASPDAGPALADSGEPATGIGNVCIVGTGAYWAPVIAFLDAKGLSDVFLAVSSDDAGNELLSYDEREADGGGRALASAPYTNNNAVDNDYFVVQLVVDPWSGSLCLDAFGMTASGTSAAAYFVANQFLGNGSFKTSNESWYVYHWTSATAIDTPSAGDTFALVASGP